MVGLALQPGAGWLVAGRPVSHLTDTWVDLENLGMPWSALIPAVRSVMSPDPTDPAAQRAAAALIEDAVRAHVPLDEEGAQVNACLLYTSHRARPRVEVFAGADLSSPAWSLTSDQVLEFGVNADPGAEGIVVGRSSFVEPTVWELHPFSGGAPRVIHRYDAVGHDPSAYACELRWLPARDGTLIPVTMAYAKGTPLTGSAPLMLWAYGAYESCDWPVWDPVIPEWLDRGVVYAQPHIRGGGEGGRRWYEEGHLAAKVNTFTDLIDVADGLAASGLIDPDRIATRGLSAGGLLQGAVFNARPDRWRIVVAEVPFVDCINSMLDDSIPLTVAEWEAVSYTHLDVYKRQDPDLVAYLAAERAAYDEAIAPLAGLRAEIGTSLRRRVPVRDDGCPWRLGEWTYQRGYAEDAQ